jgi:uncharacterized protein YcbK (DUF882 family)
MFDKGFTRGEFTCNCGCGFDTVDVETLFILEELKRWFGKTVDIVSGCRCHAYNIYIGGSKNSQHVKGRAADLSVQGIESLQVYNYFNRLYPGIYGLGKYSTFTHFDTRSNYARW